MLFLGITLIIQRHYAIFIVKVVITVISNQLISNMRLINNNVVFFIKFLLHKDRPLSSPRDGLGLACLAHHEELREDGSGLKVDREGPQHLRGRRS